MKQTLVVLFLASIPLLAGCGAMSKKQAQLSKGITLLEQGDYQQALADLRSLAHEGYAAGENVLGAVYMGGVGVPRNYAKADYWFRKAAGQGDAQGENDLGLAYFHGKGVPRNYAKADYWFRKAADQEDASAEENLSKSYSEGKGVPRNYAKAVYWAHKAVVQKARLALKELDAIRHAETSP